jgi:hypothetical protein
VFANIPPEKEPKKPKKKKKKKKFKMKKNSGDNNLTTPETISPA